MRCRMVLMAIVSPEIAFKRGVGAEGLSNRPCSLAFARYAASRHSRSRPKPVPSTKSGLRKFRGQTSLIVHSSSPYCSVPRPDTAAATTAGT